jgi:hypothetical protein
VWCRRFRVVFAEFLAKRKESLVLVTDKPIQIYETLQGILGSPLFFGMPTSDAVEYAELITEAPNSVFDALTILATQISTPANELQSISVCYNLLSIFSCVCVCVCLE